MPQAGGIVAVSPLAHALEAAVKVVGVGLEAVEIARPSDGPRLVARLGRGERPTIIVVLPTVKGGEGGVKAGSQRSVEIKASKSEA